MVWTQQENPYYFFPFSRLLLLSAANHSNQFGTLIVFLKDIFEKIDFETSQQAWQQKDEKLPSMLLFDNEIAPEVHIVWSSQASMLILELVRLLRWKGHSFYHLWRWKTVALITLRKCPSWSAPLFSLWCKYAFSWCGQSPVSRFHYNAGCI